MISDEDIDFLIDRTTRNIDAAQRHRMPDELLCDCRNAIVQLRAALRESTRPPEELEAELALVKEQLGEAMRKLETFRNLLGHPTDGSWK